MKLHENGNEQHITRSHFALTFSRESETFHKLCVESARLFSLLSVDLGFCLYIIFNLFDLLIYYFVLSIIIVTYIYFKMRSLSTVLCGSEKKRVFIARQRKGKGRDEGGDERALRPQSYKLYIWFRSHFSVFYFFLFPFALLFLFTITVIVWKVLLRRAERKKHEEELWTMQCSNTVWHKQLLNRILIRFHGCLSHAHILTSHIFTSGRCRCCCCTMKTGNNYSSLPRTQYHGCRCRHSLRCVWHLFTMCICEYLFFVKHLLLCFSSSSFFLLAFCSDPMQNGNRSRAAAAASGSFACHFVRSPALWCCWKHEQLSANATVCFLYVFSTWALCKM